MKARDFYHVRLLSESFVLAVVSPHESDGILSQGAPLPSHCAHRLFISQHLNHQYSASCMSRRAALCDARAGCRSSLEALEHCHRFINLIKSTSVPIYMNNLVVAL